jgi:opacity protein-like surface antigen
LRFAVLAAVLVGGVAHASLDGMGRISLLPGWRYTPNDYFAGSASRAGFPVVGKSSGGGPQMTASFGYMTSDTVEVGIDLFGGYQALKLRDLGGLNSVSYGALVQARAVFEVGNLLPYLGAGLGPVFALVTENGGQDTTEKLVTGYSLGGGASYRLTERFALSLDARWLLARGVVPGIGGINSGGLFAGMGLTWFLPGEPMRPGAIP